MLIKEKDDIQPMIGELERLRFSSSLTPKQKELIEDEIVAMQAGRRGEQQAAYHINFRYQNSKNFAVIHDLRIEHEGRVAQIDHLLVNRMFYIFVIESKNISTALRITDQEEFEVKTRYGWKGMASPVEQNKRHIEVLSSLIKDLGLTPKRLGFSIEPVFHQWVLVPPECNVARNTGSDQIIKMDMFSKRMDEWADQLSGSDLLSLTKWVSTDTLRQFANALLLHHRPAQFDYAAKFGITAAPCPPAPLAARTARVSPEKHKVSPAPTVTKCQNCGEILDSKTVAFCRFNKKRFGDAMLCRKCQSFAPDPKCDQCGASVPSSVIAFCRFNSERFGKKILCRDCQPK